MVATTTTSAPARPIGGPGWVHLVTRRPGGLTATIAASGSKQLQGDFRFRPYVRQGPPGGTRPGEQGPPHDDEFLFRLRRDPDVAAAMFSPPPQTMADHRAWLDRLRESPGTKLLIVQERRPGDAWRDAGWLRFTVCGDEPRHPIDVSIALEPWARGHGLATAALVRVCGLIERLRLRAAAAPMRLVATKPKGTTPGEVCYVPDPFYGAGPIRARIKPWNTASRDAFRKAGFVEGPYAPGQRWVEAVYAPFV